VYIQLAILKEQRTEMEFEWDEAKAAGNLEKHRISFEDAIGIFEGPVLESRTDRGAEERYRAIGVVEGREIAVIYTPRESRCRILSAGRARPNERRAYRQAHPAE
jgi:uncharacterized protein